MMWSKLRYLRHSAWLQATLSAAAGAAVGLTLGSGAIHLLSGPQATTGGATVAATPVSACQRHRSAGEVPATDAEPRPGDYLVCWPMEVRP
jgi:hypothetical protein